MNRRDFLSLALAGAAAPFVPAVVMQITPPPFTGKWYFEISGTDDHVRGFFLDGSESFHVSTDGKFHVHVEGLSESIEVKS